MPKALGLGKLDVELLLAVGEDVGRVRSFQFQGAFARDYGNGREGFQDGPALVGVDGGLAI